jgi:hypothetical protein
MPKPPAELTIPKADAVKVGPCPQDEVLQTPVTPVSAETLMSLQNLIINQDAHAFDKTSKQSLQRHFKKFANAAQKTFAKGVLQQSPSGADEVADDAEDEIAARGMELGSV